MTKVITRRNFIRLAGGTAAVASGASLLPRFMGKNALNPSEIKVASAQEPAANMFLGGTDGWIYLPPDPPIISPAFGQVHPDTYAPDDLAGNPLTTYMFGFRNVTGMTLQQRSNQKNKAQHNAPLFWVNQYNGSNEFRINLTNLGLAQRPDLFDEHTLHWHGFRNVIPFFDGEPTGSVSVPTGRIFTYVYRPREAGTYMWHCHVEDTEHVHMGMTGLVFVRPLQNGTPFTYNTRTFTKFAYNDGNGSTGYDREYAMFLSEMWGDSHWADAHIQLPEWSDYRADFAMLNGRVYPDTILPNSPLVEPLNPNLNYLPVQTDVNGDLVPIPGHENLQFQPHSALVKCNAGESVLLRFANLGFKEAAMTVAGLRLRVVGKDATLMKGRDGTDTSYETETLSFGAGESIDAIFTAPPYQSSPTGYNTYMLYNRRYINSNNLAAGGFGGQATEIHVYPNGVPAQVLPNT
jgi:FtsP/CotA-like multicopper oxidase with cupredoxin domain